MKISSWGAAVIAGLILFGAAAYAEEPAPPAPHGPYLVPINRNTLDYMNSVHERQKQEAAAQKAAKEEKQRQEEKQAKVGKLERKTGRKATSWQVLNR